MLTKNLYYIETRNDMKRITEAYTYGRITAKAEAILEKYCVKSSVILEKFTNDLGNHLGELLIKALDCAKSNGDDEAYNEIISCFAHLKKRVPFKKGLTNEEKSAFIKGYIDSTQI